jgi:redox-sensing transcriptional repressor
MSKGKDSAGGSEATTPKAAVGRVSLYLRQLESLLKVGQETVSSTQLGAALDITDAQVRKDLAYFGQFGYPGIGYRVAELREALRGVLGTNRTWKVALIGVGNLGRALLGYRGFANRGFVIEALFDSDPRLVGQKVHGKEIHPLDALPTLVRERKLQLAVLAVPPESAQSVCDLVASARIEGILNFAPVQLKVPEDLCLVSVDMGLQFEQLAFQVSQRRAGGAQEPR